MLFKEYHQEQNQLLPASLSESIPNDHIARMISQTTDNLDLTMIEETYSVNGQHAYSPLMLIKVIVYGYVSGLRSSRKLADKLKEDLAFMWLAGRQTPDFRTIADFRKNKLKDVKALFVQILALCKELGLIRVGKVSLDGTKFLSDASRHRMQYRKKLEKRKDELEKLVDDIFAEAEQIDKEEDELYGEGTEHVIPGLADKLKELNKKKKRLIKKHVKTEAKKADIEGKLRNMRKDRNSMSSVDKDATLMLMKEEYVAPGYNAQIATEHQVILAYDLSSNRTDYNLLRPLIKQIKENTMRKPKALIADAGYGKTMNYRFLKENKISTYIPYATLNKELVERNSGLYETPKKPSREWEEYKKQQRWRLTREYGKQMLSRRRKDVEPTFGDIKRNMNFRRFSLRTKPKCLIEMGLISLGHNIKKLNNWMIRREKQNQQQIYCPN